MYRSITPRRRLVAAALLAGTALATLTAPAHATGQSHAKPSFPGVVTSNGTQLTWKLRYSHDTGTADSTFTYGNDGDYTVMGDWTGKGYDSVGVVRNNGAGQWQWHLRNSNSSGAADITFTYGSVATDVPVVGDWTGKGWDSVGVVRDIGTQWQFLLRNSNTGGSANITVTYGSSTTDTPRVGDWTGKGYDSVGVVRNTGTQWRWLLRNTNTAGSADIDYIYGASSMWPIVGDWTGAGLDMPGGTSGNTWMLRTSHTAGSATYSFGYGGTSEYAHVAGYSAIPQTIAQARMPAYGWSVATYYSCLNSLWTAESGWNALATNGGSGAYGIPQSLPASKMATVDADYLTDPTTQITWGFNYIQDVYGDPCTAYNTWLSRAPNNWY